VIFFGVAKGGADASLGGSGVGTGRIEFADDRDVRLAGHLNRCHESCASGADYDGIETVKGHRFPSAVSLVTIGGQRDRRRQTSALRSQNPIARFQACQAGNLVNATRFLHRCTRLWKRDWPPVHFSSI
jgi:hypothetical protein